MGLDLKGIANALKGSIPAEESDSTIYAKAKGEGEITVAVEPDGEVDLTYSLNDVTLHGRNEAMVGMRLYNVEEGSDGIRLRGEGGVVDGDEELIRGAFAMLDRDMGSIKSERDFTMYNPYEEDQGY